MVEFTDIIINLRRAILNNMYDEGLKLIALHSEQFKPLTDLTRYFNMLKNNPEITKLYHCESIIELKLQLFERIKLC